MDPTANLRPYVFSEIQATSSKGYASKSPDKNKGGFTNSKRKPPKEKEKITSEDFNKQVYKRFVEFLKKRDEKLKNRYSQTEKKKRITIEDFKSSVLSRFDQHSKESQDLMANLKDQMTIEERGKRSVSKSKRKITPEHFHSKTLSRFEKYQQKAKANKEKLEEEVKNGPGLQFQGIVTPKKRVGKRLSPTYSENQIILKKKEKEGRKKVKPIDQELAMKFEEFISNKKRKVNLERQKAVEIQVKGELEECRFSPRIKKRVKSGMRSQSEHVREMVQWKNDSEARKINLRMNMVMKDNEDKFHPKILEKSANMAVIIH